MKTLHPKLYWITSLCIIITIAGCKKYDAVITPANKPANTYSGEKERNLFSLLCSIAQTTPGFFPPQVARAYGYIGIADYEAVYNGIPGAQSLAGQLNGLSSADMPVVNTAVEYNWGIAANAATTEMIRRMFETKITDANTHAVDSAEQVNLASLSAGVSQDVIDRSVKFGKDVTAAIYKYSTTDNGHQSFFDPFQLPYSLPSDSSCWVPTGAINTPVSPKWGNNRPFIAANISNAQPIAPLTYSTDTASAFYQQAMAVYNQVKNNTPEQIAITKYWADDPFNTCTPTGHTFNILTQLLKENNATLEKTAVAYAKLCIAENDAFIDCWKGKYQYVLVRPVSYIRKYIDPSFATVIGTPPFPAYTSGHSCEMGAGSRIFIDLFTDGSGNYNFEDYSQLQYGFSARTYTNFDAMAEECANSRLYGGIHYPMDNESGLTIGRIIGDNVNHLLIWPKNIK